MRFDLWAFTALLHCMALLPASAQMTGNTDVLSRGDSLSAMGEYSAVVALFDSHVQRHPAHAEAWLFLAKHRYWIKDIAGARRTYEAALQHHPFRHDLRLAYARLLMENGAVDAAKDVIRPLGSDVADAEVIRGTIAWWRGDLSAAAGYFESAVSTSPDHVEAASSLSSIRAGARPWIRLAGQSGADSQPLFRGGASAESGFFITHLQTLRAEVIHNRFIAEDSVTPITLASAGYTSFWPDIRLETELVAGIVSRTDSSDWTGRVDAGFRLPQGIRVGARWERVPYLYTVASISERVMTTAMQAGVSADKSGWLGEALLRRERFPDDNTKDVVYGWLMAPLVRTNVLTLQSGYAYGYQDAAEHRFTPRITSAPTPHRPPTWEGRYVPYYTPVNHQVHSVIGSIAVGPVRAVTLRASGSYGIFGSEEAPYVYLAGRAPMTGLYKHNIRPWNVRVDIQAALGSSMTLHLEGSHLATAWYDAFTANLSLYARF